VTDANGLAIIDASPASVAGVVRQSVDIADYYGWITVTRPRGRLAARYQGEFVFAKGGVGPDKPTVSYDCACCSLSATLIGSARPSALGGLAVFCCLFRLRRRGGMAAGSPRA
jgi:hypothetical protein